MKNKTKDEIVFPSNMTQEEVLAVIESVVNTLAPDYTFAYYGLDDIKQEATIMALKALKKYDEKRPLANFLYVHVQRRLINLIRDKFHRNDPPCKLCHRTKNGLTEHPDGKFCEKYSIWKKRNLSKANIASPNDINSVIEDNEGNIECKKCPFDTYDKKEICDIIDKKLPVNLRKYFLQLKAGVSITAYRRSQLLEAIKEILTDKQFEELTNG